MLVSPNPDDFYDAVFFIDPLTHTLDDSLVMALSKDPLNAERYSKYLQVRNSPSSPSVDDETNFDLCMPRSVQSLSEHQAFIEQLSTFIRSLLPSDTDPSPSSDSLDNGNSDPSPSPGSSGNGNSD